MEAVCIYEPIQRSAIIFHGSHAASHTVGKSEIVTYVSITAVLKDHLDLPELRWLRGQSNTAVRVELDIRRTTRRSFCDLGTHKILEGKAVFTDIIAG